MSNYMMLIFVLVTVAAAVEAVVPQYRAIARVASPGSPDIQGNVTFTRLPTGEVRVEGVILGLPHGRYGFHVHEKGDITGGCLSTGGHFNPYKKNHGAPADQDRHVGDLGNIEFDANRIGRVDITDKLIALSGENSILGRAIVLHERQDDLGTTNHPDSKKTGNAGGRVACGVIGILDPVYGWKNSAPRSSIAAGILVPLSAVLLFVY